MHAPPEVPEDGSAAEARGLALLAGCPARHGAVVELAPRWRLKRTLWQGMQLKVLSLVLLFDFGAVPPEASSLHVSWALCSIRLLLC